MLKLPLPFANQQRIGRCVIVAFHSLSPNLFMLSRGFSCSSFSTASRYYAVFFLSTTMYMYVILYFVTLCIPRIGLRDDARHQERFVFYQNIDCPLNASSEARSTCQLPPYIVVVNIMS